MKNLLFLAAMLFCFSTVFSNTDSINGNDSLTPIKKISKNSKLRNVKNCFSTCNPYKMNTLCKLIQVGNYNAVKNLIQKGAEINNESIKLTPLMYAARHNRVAIVKLLIENGANLNVRSSRKGYTALKWAKLSKATEAYDIIYAAINNHHR